MPANNPLGFLPESLQSLLMALLGGGFGEFIDRRNEAQSITPFDALRGSESKGITGVQGSRDQMSTLLNQITSGQQGSPALQSARTGFAGRVNTPVGRNDPNMPARFNPYGGGSGFGQPDQELLSLVMGLTKNRNPLISQGSNLLSGSLANRFGSRARGTGQLTPATFGGATRRPIPGNTPPSVSPPGRNIASRDFPGGSPPGRNIANRDFGNPQGLPPDLLQKLMALVR